MSKRHRHWNQVVYARYLNEGRGQGVGRDYKPWIRVQDFASCGTVSRIYSDKTSRVHHLLSNNEKFYFYLLEWSEKIIDIREQYPLADIQRAMEIAVKANIRYPIDNVSGFPYVMTCDFMVTTQGGLMARTVKQSEELKKPRVMEKLEIERRYWRQFGIDWKLVTEKDISVQKAKAIEWVRSGDADISRYDNELLNAAKERFKQKGKPVTTVAGKIDIEFSLPAGTGLLLFRCLARSKQLPIEHIMFSNFKCILDTMQESGYHVNS